MKKFIFISVLVLFVPILLRAQDNVNNDKKDFNTYVTKSIDNVQELSSNLVDEYGLKNIQFVKFENGKYIPIKAEEVKKISQVQFSSDVILVFAIIGAVLVALILLRAL
jgi:hypothetical protein